MIDPGWAPPPESRPARPDRSPGEVWRARVPALVAAAGVVAFVVALAWPDQPAGCPAALTGVRRHDDLVRAVSRNGLTAQVAEPLRRMASDFGHAGVEGDGTPLEDPAKRAAALAERAAHLVPGDGASAAAAFAGLSDAVLDVRAVCGQSPGTRQRVGGAPARGPS